VLDREVGVETKKHVWPAPCWTEIVGVQLSSGLVVVASMPFPDHLETGQLANLERYSVKSFRSLEPTFSLPWHFAVPGHRWIDPLIACPLNSACSTPN
jgi:hypothetical protein